MSADVVQAKYEELDTIAGRFQQRAESTTELYHRLQQCTQTLEEGDWEGRGSVAFSKEMQQAIFPAMQRLIGALYEAQRVTLVIREIIQLAEEEATTPFRGGNGTSLPDSESAYTPLGNTEYAQFSAGANLTVRNPTDLFGEDERREMIGRHFQGEDSAELNRLMETLLTNPRGPELEDTLNRLADVRGISRDEIHAQYEKFQQVRQQAEALNGKTDAIDLERHGDFLGSTASLRYGKIVGDAFGVDPIFGSLLNPTGGLVGAGNESYHPSDDSTIGYHGIFHDAAGYLFNYHNTGPGYDYLGEELGRDTADPLTGQRSGIQWWLKQRELDAPGPDFLLENPVVPGVLGTVVDVGLDAKQIYSGVTSGVGNLFDGDLAGFTDGMGEAAGGIARIPIDVVTGLGNTTIETVDAIGNTINDGLQEVGSWLGL